MYNKGIIYTCIRSSGFERLIDKVNNSRVHCAIISDLEEYPEPKVPDAMYEFAKKELKEMCQYDSVEQIRILYQYFNSIGSSNNFSIDVIPCRPNYKGGDHFCVFVFYTDDNKRVEDCIKEVMEIKNSTSFVVNVYPKYFLYPDKEKDYLKKEDIKNPFVKPFVDEMGSELKKHSILIRIGHETSDVIGNPNVFDVDLYSDLSASETSKIYLSLVDKIKKEEGREIPPSNMVCDSLLEMDKDNPNDEPVLYPFVLPLKNYKNCKHMREDGEIIGTIIFPPENDEKLFENIENERVRDLGRKIYPILEKENIVLEINHFKFTMDSSPSKNNFTFCLYSNHAPDKVLETFRRACKEVDITYKEVDIK